MDVSTPRKRSAAHLDAGTPSTARKRRSERIAATPRPGPLATPTSRRRKPVALQALDDPDDEEEDEPTPRAKAPPKASSSIASSIASTSTLPTPKIVPKRAPLPEHLQTLLTLHHAFNLALSLGIAVELPVLPPHPASTTRLPVPDLSNLIALRAPVEQTAGRRFGTQELARLAWLWTWDGESLPAESSAKGKEKEKEDDNPFLVKPAVPSSTAASIAGQGYLITTTRTICPSSGRRVHTHGIGIELELQPGETRQVLMGGGEGGLGNRGVGGGLRAINRWTAAGEAREEVVRQRLERWVELNGGTLEAPEEPLSYLPTPTTRDSGRSTIPPIPLLPLPKLPTTLLADSPSARLFAAADIPPPPAFASSKLKEPFATPKKTTIPGLSDPFEIKDQEKTPQTPKGSLQERNQAMLERIKARSSSKAASRTTLASALDSPGVIHRAGAGDLRRRSTLSRLEGVAEGVWMMFSAPSPGPNSLPTAPRGSRKAIPLREVADMITKSSKTPISDAEAVASLKMLTDLCPFFLTCRMVGRHEWLEMAPALAPPPSPSEQAFASSSSPQSSPRAPRVAGLTSPSLAGPASPGRVRRTGLARVREVIRRELGEW